MWMWRSSLCAIVLVAGVSAQAADGVNPKPAPAANEPTTITAQKMTVRNQESKAYFEGAVVLTKGALVVHSDAMVVSFKQKDGSSPAAKGIDTTTDKTDAAAKKPKAKTDALSGPGSRAVSMVEATGHVKIEKDGGTATCQKAVYYEEDEKIVLTGEPVAWQKGTRVTGNVITMYLAEDRSVVEGESRVLIEPEGVR